MEFSLENIKLAHAKFTGVDFPKLIQEFKKMGMVTNTFHLQSGKVTYVHRNGETIEVQANAVDQAIQHHSSAEAAKDVLKRHQAGQTDFATFCSEIAGAGVCKWKSKMDEMTCSYYDLNDQIVVVETIPSVTATIVERPARKLIYLRHHASDYFSACEEVGCEWENYFNSIPVKYDTAAGGRLPSSLIGPGTGTDAFFVEVPADYAEPIPDGYAIADLAPCTYIYFQGMPFEDANEYSQAIGLVNEAIENYPFERFGWEISDDAPYLGMGAEPKTGARTAVPVKKRK